MNVRIGGLYTDYYQLTMAQVGFLNQHHHIPCTFEYFFRKLPFDGGYGIFCGLSTLCDAIQNFTYRKKEITYLKHLGFNHQFIQYLSQLKLKICIYSMHEGEVVFPHEPILYVKGTLIEAQLIETLILNTLNYETAVATKSARLCDASGGRPIIDFGMRRAPGYGSIQSSRAAYVGGVESSSNVQCGLQYNIPVTGSLSHAWIQSFENELDAFRMYLKIYPNGILLLDTYNILHSGLPNAIKVAKEVEKKGHRLYGIRIDSGDLAYLSKKIRKKLNEENLDYIKIITSNQLNEWIIRSLIEQKAPIDIFGVGTALSTAHPDNVVNGVYKLVNISGKDTMKVSDNDEKMTLPAYKHVLRYNDMNNQFVGDGIHINETNHNHTYYQYPYPHIQKPIDFSSYQSHNLLHQYIRQGDIIKNSNDVNISRNYAKKRLKQINSAYKRFENPHIYPIGISKTLKKIQENIIKKYT